MNDLGNLNWITGFKDGMAGNEQASNHPDYLDGYSRGYETSERQSANQEYFERKKA